MPNTMGRGVSADAAGAQMSSVWCGLCTVSHATPAAQRRVAERLFGELERAIVVRLKEWRQRLWAERAAAAGERERERRRERRQI